MLNKKRLAAAISLVPFMTSVASYGAAPADDIASRNAGKPINTQTSTLTKEQAELLKYTDAGDDALTMHDENFNPTEWKLTDQRAIDNYLASYIKQMNSGKAAHKPQPHRDNPVWAPTRTAYHHVPAWTPPPHHEVSLWQSAGMKIAAGVALALVAAGGFFALSRLRRRRNAPDRSTLKAAHEAAITPTPPTPETEPKPNVASAAAVAANPLARDHMGRAEPNVAARGVPAESAAAKPISISGAAATSAQTAHRENTIDQGNFLETIRRIMGNAEPPAAHSPEAPAAVAEANPGTISASSAGLGPDPMAHVTAETRSIRTRVTEPGDLSDAQNDAIAALLKQQLITRITMKDISFKGKQGTVQEASLYTSDEGPAHLTMRAGVLKIFAKATPDDLKAAAALIVHVEDVGKAELDVQLKNPSMRAALYAEVRHARESLAIRNELEAQIAAKEAAVAQSVQPFTVEPPAIQAATPSSRAAALAELKRRHAEDAQKPVTANNADQNAPPQSSLKGETLELIRSLVQHPDGYKHSITTASPPAPQTHHLHRINADRTSTLALSITPNETLLYTREDDDFRTMIALTAKQQGGDLLIRNATKEEMERIVAIARELASNPTLGLPAMTINGEKIEPAVPSAHTSRTPISVSPRTSPVSRTGPPRPSIAL